VVQHRIHLPRAGAAGSPAVIPDSRRRSWATTPRGLPGCLGVASPPCHPFNLDRQLNKSTPEAHGLPAQMDVKPSTHNCRYFLQPQQKCHV